MAGQFLKFVLPSYPLPHLKNVFRPFLLLHPPWDRLTSPSIQLLLRLPLPSLRLAILVQLYWKEGIAFEIRQDSGQQDPLRLLLLQSFCVYLCASNDKRCALPALRIDSLID